MGRHSNWRDCQAWRMEGLEMSTTSNEAAKLYDASLSQLVGWYDDSSVGGLVNSVKNMIEADNTFVMGHVMANALGMIGGDSQNPEHDPTPSQNVQRMVTIAEGQSITQREKLHVEAVKSLLEGQTKEALAIWENILLDYPTDMFAIKLCESGYLKIGDLTQQRDSKYRIFPHWNRNIPLYSNLFGMMAFGEMETKLYDKAEKNARTGFGMNPLDGWAIHALAHVLDHTGRYNEGIQLLTSTVKDWSTNDMLACHNYWHLGLFHIEKGDLDTALHHFDSEMKRYDQTLFQGTDRASFLLRLEMEGVPVGDRWSEVHEQMRPHLDDHSSGFSDIHCMMACIGAKHRQAGQDMLDSLKDYIKTGKKQQEYRQMAERVGVPLCEALLAWDDQDFARVTELLFPIRYEVNRIGGSNAQRDVISQLLIHSSIQSSERKHHKIARSLINERRAHKDTPMLDRLMGKLLNEQHE